MVSNQQHLDIYNGLPVTDEPPPTRRILLDKAISSAPIVAKATRQLLNDLVDRTTTKSVGLLNSVLPILNTEPPSLPGGFVSSLDSPTLLAGSVGDCTRDKAYLAIIITVVPLWAILTTLIVFVLLSFHKSLRATKIYDDCTKNTAQYAYYIEIRTGDTSSTYNRRRTTLTIDMFDDNQVVLARIAIPGHVIFGRRDMPTSIIDDERYSELRVTRFWLYRAVRLRKVHTIRITHSCTEPEAKIMIYGFQVRANEPDFDKSKQFFPIMSYISAYGSTARPNACFDHELNGSISNMGGSQDDNAFVSNQLSRVDYIILIFLLTSIVWLMASKPKIFIPGDSSLTVNCVYRGLIIGTVSYGVIFCVGIFHRYLVKYYYAKRIGIGVVAIFYYLTCGAILLVAGAFWIYTTILAYKELCPDFYTNWLLTIAMALIIIVFLGIINALGVFVLGLLSPKATEQYLLPDEYSNNLQSPQHLDISPKASRSQPGSYPANYYRDMSSATRNYMSKQGNAAMGWQQSPILLPTVGHPSPTYMHSPVMHSPVAPYLMTSPAPYKTLQYPGITPQTPSQPVNTYLQQQQQQQQHQGSESQNYHHPGGGIKHTKKVGSTESTGSTYYQQLMKNKGGVKSISQYGELLKQKKQPAKHK